jgi:hypothetical protein
VAINPNPVPDAVATHWCATVDVANKTIHPPHMPSVTAVQLAPHERLYATHVLTYVDANGEPYNILAVDPFSLRVVEYDVLPIFKYSHMHLTGDSCEKCYNTCYTCFVPHTMCRYCSSRSDGECLAHPKHPNKILFAAIGCTDSSCSLCFPLCTAKP